MLDMPNAPPTRSRYPTVDTAKAACDAENTCGGITASKKGHWEIRASSSPDASPDGETSYHITNAATCHVPAPISDDPSWTARGAAAYQGT